MGQALAWLSWLWGELVALGVAIQDAVASHLPVFALVVAGAFLVVVVGLLARRRWPRRAPRLRRSLVWLWAWLRPRLSWGLAVRLLRLTGLVLFSIIVFSVAYALVCLTIFFFLMGVLGLQGRNWPAYALVALITAYSIFAWKQVKAMVLPSRSSAVSDERDLIGWFGLG